MTELSVPQLVTSARTGCVESFSRLYDRYYGPMVALAYSILTDHALAEDAAQEAFAVACRDLGRLRRPKKFPAWLAGICRNSAKESLAVRKDTNASPSIQLPLSSRMTLSRTSL